MTLAAPGPPDPKWPDGLSGNFAPSVSSPVTLFAPMNKNESLLQTKQRVFIRFQHYPTFHNKFLSERHFFFLRNLNYKNPKKNAKLIISLPQRFPVTLFSLTFVVHIPLPVLRGQLRLIITEIHFTAFPLGLAFFVGLIFW